MMKTRLTCRAAKQVAARFWKDETGATAVEYGLLAGLISLAIITGLAVMGTSLRDNVFGVLSSALTAATSSS